MYGRYVQSMIKRTPKLRLVTAGDVEVNALDAALRPVRHFVEVAQVELRDADLVVACNKHAPALREQCSCPVVLCRGDGAHGLPKQFHGQTLESLVLHIFRQKVEPQPHLAF